MKLQHVRIEGFRAFTTRVEVDLSADVVILVGPNGTGKTSLLDAILWALTGRLTRVGDSEDRVVSLYAPAGLARVSLTVGDESGPLTIIRTRLEGKTELTLESDRRTLEGAAAGQELIRRLWDAGLASESPMKDLHEVLTRSVYLQQDLVRQFVDRDKAADRFGAVSQLVGVGRVAEFQRKLENSRHAWARVMTQKENDVEQAMKRLAVLRSDIERLGRDAIGTEAAQAWTAWWTQLADKNLGVRPIPDVSMPNAGQVIDQLLRALQARRAHLQRQLSVVPQIREDIGSIASATSISEEDIEKLRRAVAAARESCASLETQVFAAEKRDGQAKAAILAQRSSDEEMGSLAQLALRHLSQHCPVCDQSIDIKVVEERLRSLVGKVGQHELGGAVSDTPALRTRLEQGRSDLKEAERNLEEAVNANNVLLGRRTLLASQLADLELEQPNSAELEKLAASLQLQIDEIGDLYKAGEALSIAIVQLSEENKRDDLLKQEKTGAALLTEVKQAHSIYKRVHEAASEVIDAVRDVADDAVNQQVEKIEPMLKKIYSRIDPHPTFRLAGLRSHTSHGKGRVETSVSDARGGKNDNAPSEIFSSSQTSALAVSIFLAMNLTSENIPLHSAVLDDPLQSLDDINVLGLLDVLRRTRVRRQLLVSTHDANFAQLLMRKFRPLEDGQRTTLVTLQNWERSGVSLEQETIQDVPARLQVVG